MPPMPFGSITAPRPLGEPDSETESDVDVQPGIMTAMSSDGEDSAVAGLTALGAAGTAAALAAAGGDDDDSDAANAALDAEIANASGRVDRAVLASEGGANDDEDNKAKYLPASMSATSLLTGSLGGDDIAAAAAAGAATAAIKEHDDLPQSMSATSILTGEIAADPIEHADEIPARADFPEPYQVEAVPIELRNKEGDEGDSNKGLIAAAAVGAAAGAAVAGGATAAAMAGGGVPHSAEEEGQLSVFGTEGSKSGTAGAAATLGLGAAVAAANKKQQEEEAALSASVRAAKAAEGDPYFRSGIFEKMPMSELTAELQEADTTPKILATFPPSRELNDPDVPQDDVEDVLEPARKIGDYELPEPKPEDMVTMSSNPVRGAPDAPLSIKAVPLSEEAKRERQAKLCKIGSIVAIIIIILGVGLGVGLGNRSAGEVADTMAPTATPVEPEGPTREPGPPIEPGFEPTAEPTAEPIVPGAPTAAPNTEAPTLAPFDVLLLYLGSISPDGGAALEDTTSPQYQAAEWLFTNPGLSEMSETQINQRYSLATVFLAMDGENWILNDGWMEPATPECEWIGIGCETALIPSRRTTSGLRGNKNNADNNNDHNQRRTQATMMVVKKVQLFELNLSGQIPSEIAILTDTEDISIYGNAISGTIPEVISDIAGLQVLQLDGNVMTGSLPAGFFDLTELVKVRLEFNQYTGILPATVGQLTKMQMFRVDNNMMTGTLPAELGAMTSLVELRVNNNMFTGTIPRSLGDAAIAEEMYFHENELTGFMPLSICALRLDDLTSDCAATPPEVRCSCCTECYPLAPGTVPATTGGRDARR